jgi:DNA-binding MarR family transcriptional regulator
VIADTELPATPAEHHLLHDLVGEAAALSHAFERAAAADTSALASAERDLLRLIAGNGPQTVPQIARRRGTSRQNIQIVVNRLISRSAVSLATNPDHQISSLIEITETGRAMLAEAEGCERSLLAEILPEQSNQELIAATKLLQDIRHQLELRAGLTSGKSQRHPPIRLKNELQGKAKPRPAVAAPDSEQSELPYNLL